MNVLFTINNAFAPWLGVTLESLFDNNKDLSLKVYVLCDNLSEINKKILISIGTRYNQSIHFLKLSGEALMQLKRIESNLECGLNYYYFARLVLDKFLPDDLNSILYLDTDIIINGSLKALEGKTFDEKTAAYVVKDVVRVEDYKRLGIDSKKGIYFNAGVLYINLLFWRKNQIGQKAIDFLINNPKANFADQDALNFLLNDSVKYLHPKFNCLVLFCANHDYVKKRVLKDDFKDVLDAAENPIVIHYVFLDKPWFKGGYIPYKNKWRSYYKSSPYRSIKLKYRGGPKGFLKYAIKTLLGLIGINRYKTIFDKKFV